MGSPSAEGVGAAGGGGEAEGDGGAEGGADSQPGADTQAGGETQAAAGQDTVAGGDGDDAIAAARAVKPEAAEGYALNFSDKAKTQLGDLADDPAVKALREHALAKGWTQGEFDDRIAETVNVLAEKGLLAPTFDPAAELAKLGEGGKAKQEEIGVFAKNLLDRKEITPDEYEEMMSLVPTAAGTTLLTKLRRLMGAHGEIQVAGTPAESRDQMKARAAEMRRDPKYGRDAAWTKETDELRMRAYGGAA